MGHAELGDQRIDRSDLDARPAASVPEFRCGNVIVPGRLEQREGRKSFDDLFACLCAGETLQQLLQDDSRGHDDIRSQQGFLEVLHLRCLCLAVASERQGPDARVNEQCHPRDRSAL